MMTTRSSSIQNAPTSPALFLRLYPKLLQAMRILMMSSRVFFHSSRLGFVMRTPSTAPCNSKDICWMKNGSPRSLILDLLWLEDWCRLLVPCPEAMLHRDATPLLTTIRRLSVENHLIVKAIFGNIPLLLGTTRMLPFFLWCSV